MLAGVSGKAIEGRSLGQIAWMRLRRDKVAMGGGIFIVFLILVAIIGPHLVQNPTTYPPDLINPTFSRPNGAWGGISTAHPFGVEPVNGRDVLARVVNGAQVSMLIAFLATALAVSIGVFMGVIAGYFGGWVDAVIARSMDVFLAFPLLVFAIALVGVIPSSAFGLSGNSLRIGAADLRDRVLRLALHGPDHPRSGAVAARAGVRRRRPQPGCPRALHPVPRAAAEPGGADPGVLHAADPGEHPVRGGAVLPRGRHHPAHAELGRHALGRGQQRLYSIDPMFMIVPGLAIFITVMAFNLFGDGLRDALDPRSSR